MPKELFGQAGKLKHLKPYPLLDTVQSHDFRILVHLLENAKKYLDEVTNPFNAIINERAV